MSENRNWSSTGEQIKNALSEALQSGDFKNLNDLVSQTVTDAISEAGKYVSLNNNSNQRTSQGSSDSSSENTQTNSGPANIPIWQQRAQERERQRQMKLQQEWQRQQQRRQEQEQSQHAPQVFRKNLPSIKVKKVGSVSNVLYQVFGGIGLGISGLIALIRMFALLAGDTTLGGWIMNFLFLAVFYGMIRFGIGQKRRLKRAQRYLQLCDYRVYGEVAKLASGTGKSEEYVVKDLRKMLALGIFPEGHLDKQNTCFMLNDIVYRQYLEAENSRRIREAENRKALEDQKASQAAQTPPAPEVAREQVSELQAMVSEGMEYIRKLRNLNDRIPGEVISAKLFCLENLLKDIFDSVRTHPELMPRMHKLMNYYLPTTLKLVESYEEFDRISSPSAEIIKAKAEIENTLDTINEAFRELLNTLFQNAVFDATTDAQVLKSMLAREGLMREKAFAAVENDT